MMAFDLGLHKTTRDLKIPPQDLEQQVRVFWNIYVYEKYVASLVMSNRTCAHIVTRVLAAEMGRPVMVRRVHCEARRLAEDQSDEYETLMTSPKGEPVILHVSYVERTFLHVSYFCALVHEDDIHLQRGC